MKPAGENLHPPVPSEWAGSEAAFQRCLDDFASALLESVAVRCDALQRFDGADDEAVAFNAGVVAATRLMMEAASALRDPPPGEAAPD